MNIIRIARNCRKPEREPEIAVSAISAIAAINLGPYEWNWESVKIPNTLNYEENPVHSHANYKKSSKLPAFPAFSGQKIHFFRPRNLCEAEKLESTHRQFAVYEQHHGKRNGRKRPRPLTRVHVGCPYRGTQLRRSFSPTEAVSRLVNCVAQRLLNDE